MFKISIITPVYNNVNYIEECIKNVISQNCQYIEHLIIDGGSKDGTVEVISKYAEQNLHIKWISEKDQGQSHAMNKGIALAQGEYISFLNVDDYYSENTFNDILKIIEKKHAPDFIVGNCNVWLSNGELQYVNKPKKLKPWHLLSGFYLPVNPSAYFYKKSIHQKTGSYNTQNHFNMDIEFLIKASLITNIKYYPINWGNFRLLPETKTFTDQSAGLLEIRKKELYTKFLNEVDKKIYFLTKLVVLKEGLKRKIFRFKKCLMVPLDAIYWKTKIIINKYK